jgi:hypothetical protein
MFQTSNLIQIYISICLGILVAAIPRDEGWPGGEDPSDSLSAGSAREKHRPLGWVNKVSTPTYRQA